MRFVELVIALAGVVVVLNLLVVFVLVRAARLRDEGEEADF